MRVPRVAVEQGFRAGVEIGDRAVIAWSNPAFQVVLDQRGQRLHCGDAASCAEYVQQWEAVYHREELARG